MKANASDIYEFMPDNYFEYSQAPLIRVDMLDGSNVNHTSGTYKLYIGSNLFDNNRNYQVVTFSSLAYQGSLFQLDCQLEFFQLILSYNLVQNNFFIGDQSSLFYINGGLVRIFENNFQYNGMTSEEFE